MTVLITLQRLIRWFAELAIWVASVRLFWMCVLVILCAYLFAFHTFPSELAVRGAGLALQVLGLSIALIGLLETRAFFGLPSVPSLFVDWLSRIPQWRRHVTVSVGAATLAMATMKARASAWINMCPEDSLEKKVESLVKNVERLKGDLHGTQKELDELAHKHTEALKNEAHARETAAAEIKKHFKAVLTDGLLVSLVGLIWLLVGIVLSTMSVEFSS